jgi:hypothetical protein
VNPVTDSLNVIVTAIGDVFVGFVADELTVTVGAVVSTTSALPPAKDEALAKLGRVSVASAFDAFLMVPPLRVKAAVER